MYQAFAHKVAGVVLLALWPIKSSAQFVNLSEELLGLWALPGLWLLRFETGHC